MEITGKTALVTGAAGTVGSAVVQRLAEEGARVRALVRRATEVRGAAEVVVADLLNEDGVARAANGTDLAVHCAAALSQDWDENRATNVRGTQNLLDALRAAGTRRLVHVSTISVYDFRSRNELDEEAPLWTEEVDAYGYTKAEAERRVQEAREGGLEVVILRPGAILSLHPKSHWGPRALERAREGDGPLFPTRSIPWVHVDNLADAVVLAATRSPGEGEAYNLVDGLGSTEDYQEVVFRKVGRSAPPLPDDAPDLRVPADRLRRRLGYDPEDRWGEFLEELSALAGPEGSTDRSAP